jgi:hypothetical protein
MRRARMLYISTVMPDKLRFPPLTRDQLRAIWQRAPSPAVRLLLWEIHRLRALVLRANDFVRHATQRGAAKGMDTTSSAILDGLRESLEDEPVVREEEARRIER